MRERTKGKESLPQIFVDDKYFGGLIELKILLNYLKTNK